MKCKTVFTADTITLPTTNIYAQVSNLIQGRSINSVGFLFF